MKIVEFNNKKEKEDIATNIKVVWTDNTSEVIDADMFGESEDIDNFVAIVSSKTEKLIRLINLDCVRSLSFVDVEKINYAPWKPNDDISEDTV